jgi:deoxycytidine triphosphate deaminase
MKLVVLTGARGAGKSTVAAAVAQTGAGRLMKPFTTRKPRSEEEDEYHFLENSPSTDLVSWIIESGSHSYGMLRSEVGSVARDEVGITVFDPERLDVLSAFGDKSPSVETVVVGLNTIKTVEEQVRRVGGDSDRTMSQDEIDKICKIIQKADVRLQGSFNEVVRAVGAICRILSSRGGVVQKEQLEPLIVAGQLLDPYSAHHLQGASYDLRVGEEIWCGGKFIDLDAHESVFEIPPYSYAIVRALEKAAMPPFLTGQFDLKVSHFLSGVILSNGPQVDPGYEGDLFCMLFNGSSRAAPLRYKDHFATIQFFTTTLSGQAYGGQYSLKERLRNTMPAAVLTSPGGAIFATIDEKMDEAKNELRREIPKDRLGLYLSVFGITSAILFVVAGWTFSMGNDAKNAATEARETKGKLELEVKKVSDLRDKYIAELRAKSTTSASQGTSMGVGGGHSGGKP